MGTPERLQELRKTREHTLELVASLTQSEIDHAREGEWSVGEILDHLRKSDDTYLREIRTLVTMEKQGKRPQKVVSLAQMDFSVPVVPRFLLPFVDLPMATFNYFLPNGLREAFLGTPIVPAKTASTLQPESGKPKESLVRALWDSLKATESLFLDNPGIGFDAFRYYHPIFGFNDAYDILGLMASHERRHQKQLRQRVDELRTTAEAIPSVI